MADLDQRAQNFAQTDPTDDALDWWSKLRDEVTGALKGGSVWGVREALAVRFQAFTLDTDQDGVVVRPLLRLEPAIQEAIRFLRDDDARPCRS